MLWSAGPNRLQPLSQAREGWHKVVMLRTLLVSAAFALWAPAMAEPVPGVSALAPSEIVTGAAAGEWTAIAPSDLRVMELAPDAAGIHCCGMVGVGRNLPPDTGTGAELYTVIGHAPRHLDHNIALVGPVIEGIEHLSWLPRGTGDLGFYETAAERVPIGAMRCRRCRAMNISPPRAPTLPLMPMRTAIGAMRFSSSRRAARISATFRCRCGG